MSHDIDEIDFSKMCRIDTDHIKDALSFDLDIIFQCYEESCELGYLVLIPYYMCKLTKHKYSQHEIYNDILDIMRRKEKIHLLVDVMPYIDSYLDMMCK